MSSTLSKSSAIHAFAQSAAAKVLIIGLNAGTGILTARALAPTGRGELSAMILWYSLLAGLFTLGIPSALTYQLRLYPERRSEILGAGLVLSLAIVSGISVAAMFALPYFMPQYSPDVVFFARIFILNTPIATFLIIGRAAVESQGKYSPSNISLAGPPLLTLAGLVGLHLLHSFTPVHAAWCYVLAGFPSVVLMARSLRQTLRPRINKLVSSSRLLLAYGLRSYGIDICGTMSVYIDQAFVVRLFHPDMMGTYVVALSLSRMLNVFHTAVVMVLFPKAVNRSAHQVIDMTGRAVRMTTLMTSTCGVGVMLAGPYLLKLLYGPEYRGAANLLRVLVVEVVIAGATQVMSQAFMALARPGVITALQALGLALTVPMMMFLVPRYGIIGAAVSLLFSTCARFLFVLASFSRYLGLPRPRLIVNHTDFQAIGSAITQILRVPQTSRIASKV